MGYLHEHFRFLIVLAIASARIGGALAVCPAFSESMISGAARRVAILSFSFLAVPLVMRGYPPEGLSVPALTAIALREAFIGFLIGFFATVPFWVAENVGNLIDNQRGATMGEVYSPLSGAQVSSTGIFFTQIVSTIFYVSGAVFLFLGALYKSYGIWPIFGDGGMALNAHAPALVLSAVDGMLKTTVVIGAPIVIVMFLATVGLGFVNRTAPQLNVFFLSMPVKSALGIGMLVVYLPFIMDMLMYTKDGDVLGPVMKLLGG